MLISQSTISNSLLIIQLLPTTLPLLSTSDVNDAKI